LKKKVGFHDDVFLCGVCVCLYACIIRYFYMAIASRTQWPMKRR